MKKKNNDNVIKVDFTKPRYRKLRNPLVTKNLRKAYKPAFVLENWLLIILSVVCVLGVLLIAR